MSKQDKEKWDQKYINKPQLLKPREASINIQNFIRECHGKKAIDIACGAGRNSIYLAKNGFYVDAIDIAEVALNSLNKYAQDEKLSSFINTLYVDLDNFTPIKDNYDLAIMTNFLDRNFIKKAKNALHVEGIFIVETYMKDENNEKIDSNPSNLLTKNELKDIFTSWDILYYDEFENEQQEIYNMKKQVIVAKKIS